MPVQKYLESYFKFPKELIFAQVATVGEDGPKLRTMRLFDLDTKGCLIFLSCLKSQKCLEISADPRIAVCIYESGVGQLTLWGRAELRSLPEWSERLQTYWDPLPPELRRIYSEKVQTELMPSNFASIAFVPSRFEWLGLALEYVKSERLLYSLVGGCWKKKPISISS